MWQTKSRRASHLVCFPFPSFPSTGRLAFLPGGRKLQVARRAEEQLGSVKAMATVRTTILAQRWKHWKVDHFRRGRELMVAVDFLSTWILNNDAGIRLASSYFVYGLPVLLTLLHLSIWPSVKAIVTHTRPKCCFVALGLRQEITKVEICIHRDCKSCLAIGIRKGHVIWWVWGNHTRSWNILVAQHFVKWTVWCIQFSVTSAEEEEEERSWKNNLRISQKELLLRCRPDLALLIPFGETKFQLFHEPRNTFSEWNTNCCLSFCAPCVTPKACVQQCGTTTESNPPTFGSVFQVAEYDCFDECPFGPNVRLGQSPTIETQQITSNAWR